MRNNRIAHRGRSRPTGPVHGSPNPGKQNKKLRSTTKPRRTTMRDKDLGILKEKHLPAISAATGVGDARLLKRYLRTALSHGVPLRDLEETILQCYLFAGFPAALEGFVALREVCDRPVKGRIRAAKPSAQLFIKRGEELCRSVYGSKYVALKRRSLELHPDLWHWMILEGYGKVLSRPPLTAAQRELCIIACLVVTGWTRQLRSHIHGALNVGCTPGSIISAVKIAGKVAGPWPLQWGLEIAREEIAKAGAETSLAGAAFRGGSTPSGPTARSARSGSRTSSASRSSRARSAHAPSREGSARGASLGLSRNSTPRTASQRLKARSSGARLRKARSTSRPT